MPRLPLQVLLNQQAQTPAVESPAPALNLTPAMRRMILAEAEHGDLFHGLTGKARAAATQTRGALQKRGLLDFTGKPTSAALAAARS